jgi:hypothetical protein
MANYVLLLLASQSILFHQDRFDGICINPNWKHHPHTIIEQLIAVLIIANN